jgi:C1A family cysteine protease
MSHAYVQNQLRHVAGWRPGVPDHRDRKYLPLVATVPTHVDLTTSPFMPRVEDQGQLGSCTANAGTSLMEFVRRKMNKPPCEFSRLFVYYNSRKIGNLPLDQDTGAVIRDVLKGLAFYGACLEPLWPYNIPRFAQQPNHNAYKNGASHQVLKYLSCADLHAIKASLAQGYPVEIGFSVIEAMLSDEVAVTGVVPMPTPSDQVVGGHAVLVCGYDDAKHAVMFQNSWSTAWGQGGYGWLPYGYFTEGLADDFWTVRTEE